MGEEIKIKRPFEKLSAEEPGDLGQKLAGAVQANNRKEILEILKGIPRKDFPEFTRRAVAGYGDKALAYKLVMLRELYEESQQTPKVAPPQQIEIAPAATRPDLMSEEDFEAAYGNLSSLPPASPKLPVTEGMPVIPFGEDGYEELNPSDSEIEGKIKEGDYVTALLYGENDKTIVTGKVLRHRVTIPDKGRPQTIIRHLSGLTEDDFPQDARKFLLCVDSDSVKIIDPTSPEWRSARNTENMEEILMQTGFSPLDRLTIKGRPGQIFRIIGMSPRSTTKNPIVMMLSEMYLDEVREGTRTMDQLRTEEREIPLSDVSKLK